MLSKTAGVLLALSAVVFALLAAGCGGDDDATTTGGDGNGAATAGNDGGGEAGGQDGGGGDGGGGGDSSAASLGKAEFVEQADEACAAVRQRLRQEVKANPSRYIPGTIAALRSVAEELEAVGLPEGEEERVEEMLGYVSSAVVEAEKGGKAVGKANELLAKAQNLADQAGLKECLLF